MKISKEIVCRTVLMLQHICEYVHSLSNLLKYIINSIGTLCLYVLDWADYKIKYSARAN